MGRSGDHVEYILYPTKPEMLDELYAFVQHAYAATQAPPRPGQTELPSSRTVSVNGTLPSLYYSDSGRKLWRSAITSTRSWRAASTRAWWRRTLRPTELAAASAPAHTFWMCVQYSGSGGNSRRAPGGDGSVGRCSTSPCTRRGSEAPMPCLATPSSPGASGAH